MVATAAALECNLGVYRRIIGNPGAHRRIIGNPGAYRRIIGKFIADPLSHWF